MKLHTGSKASGILHSIIGFFFRSSLFIFFLVVSLVVSEIPSSVVNVKAAEILQQNQESTAPSDEIPADTVQDQTYDPGSIQTVQEVIDKRTSYSKTYLKSDQSYETHVYEQQVHYMNKDYEWIEIDNRLQKIDNRYQNISNIFTISFPETLSLTESIDIKMGDYRIGWSMATLSSSPITFENRNLEEKELKDFEPAYQRILYRDVKEQVDLEYQLVGTEVKENILLNQYKKDFVVIFDYHLSGLTIKEDMNQSLVLVNNQDEAILHLGDLVMYDSKFQSSTDIALSYQPIGVDTYQITIQPNEEWLRKASYPVTIDPTLFVNENTSIFDYKSISNSTTTPVNSTFLVGDDGGTVHRGFIEIPTNLIPENAMVTFAHLKTTISNNLSAGENTILLHDVPNKTLSEIVSFNSYTRASKITDYGVINQTSQGNLYFDISSLYRQWIFSGQSKGLIELRYQNENNGWAWFDDTHTINLTPSVVIGYRHTVGLYDFMTYNSQPIGDKNIGYVQDYSGLQTTYRNEYNFETSLQTLRLEMFHNGQDKNISIGYGNGWRTNYNLDLTYDGATDQYAIKDGTGASTFFIFDHFNYREIELTTLIDYYYIAEDGSKSNVVLTVIDNLGAEEFHSVRLVTQDYVEYHFGKSYNNKRMLTYINDPIKKLTWTINYVSTASPLIAEVKDKSGNKIVFNYLGGKLSSTSLELYQPDGTYNKVEQIDYTYYSYSQSGVRKVYIFNDDGTTSIIWVPYTTTINTSQLITVRYQSDYNNDVTFSESSRVNYAYINGLMKSIQSSNGEKVAYTYSANRVAGITFSINDVVQSSVSYTYGFNTTKITNLDSNDYVQYNFDGYGQTVLIFNNDGIFQQFTYMNIFSEYSRNNQIKDYTKPYNYNQNHQLIYQSNPQQTYTNYLLNGDFEFSTEYDQNWVNPNSSSAVVSPTNVTINGVSALKIKSTSSLTSSIDQLTTLPVGSYVLTGYIQSNDHEGKLDVSCVNIGSITNKDYHTYTLDHDWEYAVLSFDVTTSSTVRTKLSIDPLKEAIFDDIQLTKADVSRNNNLFPNGTLELTDYSVWDKTENNNQLINSIPDAPFGPLVIGIEGNANELKTVSINLTDYLDLSTSDTYHLTIWSLFNGTPLTAGQLGSRFYQARIEYAMTNYYGANVTMMDTILLDSTNSAWQSINRNIVLNNSIYEVTLHLDYQGLGSVYFDGFSLYNGLGGTQYTLDEKGKIQKITEADGNITTFEYYDLVNMNGEFTSSYGRPVRVSTSTGYKIYEYTDAYYSYFSSNNVKTTYELNSNGQVVRSSYGDQNQFLSTSTYYTSLYNNQYIQAQQDEQGRVTLYNVDSLTSLLTSITNPKNVSTTYAYYDNGQIKQISSEDSQVMYVYNAQQQLIEIILANDYKYLITYDNFQRVEKIEVVNTSFSSPLIKYTYVEKNGKYTSAIQSQSYANQDFYVFNYDHNDQLKEIFRGHDSNLNGVFESSEYQLRFSYDYDAMGKLYQLKSFDDFGVISDIETYHYLAEGMLESYSDAQGNTVFFHYNQNHQLVGSTYAVGNSNYQVSYDTLSGGFVPYDLIDESKSLNLSMLGSIMNVEYLDMNSCATKSYESEVLTFQNDCAVYNSISALGGFIPVQGNSQYFLNFNLESLDNAVDLIVYEFASQPLSASTITDIHYISRINSIGLQSYSFEVPEQTQFILIGLVSVYSNVIQLSDATLYHQSNALPLYDQTLFSNLNGLEVIKDYQYEQSALSRLQFIEQIIGNNLLDSNTGNDIQTSVIGKNYTYIGNSYQVSSLLFTLDSGTIQYDYSYDVLGNIQSLKTKINSVLSSEEYYDYDGLNQLIKESRYSANEDCSTITSTCYTKLYEYDARGNMTKETSYKYNQDSATPLMGTTSNWNLGQTVTSCGYNSSTAKITFSYPTEILINTTTIPFTISGNSNFSSSNGITFYQVKISNYLYSFNVNESTDKVTINIPLSKLTKMSATAYKLDFQTLYWSGCHSGSSTYAPTDPSISVVNHYSVAPSPTEKVEYTYSSNWLDQLESALTSTYQNGLLTTTKNQSWTYDAQGNPTDINRFVYQGSDVYHAHVTYFGRQLEKVRIHNPSDNVVATLSYVYNDQGIRTQKTIVETSTKKVTDYFLLDNLVLSETTTTFTKNNLGNFILSTTSRIVYQYDFDASLVSFHYDANVSDSVNPVDYFYLRNLQGDITHVLDSEGTIVVSYTYDAWGTIIKTTDTSINQHVSKINPYTYRGYRLDQETGLYYLNSRYYDASNHRFLNADSVNYLEPQNLGGLNLYTINLNYFTIFGNTSYSKNSNPNLTQSTLHEVKMGEVLLPEIPWILNNISNIFGSYSSVTYGLEVFLYVIQNPDFFRAMALDGISFTIAINDLPGPEWGFGQFEYGFLILDVGLDIYASIQDKIGLVGTLTGASLTIVKGVGMILTSKGIMFTSTAIGTNISPGIGTAIGFGVGVVLTIVFNIYVGGWLDDQIDNLAKCLK